MKRKDYKEVSPEPKDYGGSDYSDDRSSSSWAATGRDDNDLYYWEEVPKEKTTEGPNDSSDDDDGDDGDGGDPEMTSLSGYIRCVVRLAITPFGSVWKIWNEWLKMTISF
jgi:hypothetical protein